VAILDEALTPRRSGLASLPPNFGEIGPEGRTITVMTALGVSLLMVGAIMILIEAHVPTLGVLGGPGIVALAAGAVVAVIGLGGGVALGVVSALLLAAVAGAVLALSVGKGVAVRRRRIRAGPESLIGHIGVVRSWANPTGCVLVDGALWRARRSVLDDEDQDDLSEGDAVVVDHLEGLTIGVRRAEEWERVR
jgi:membrane-bound ClpP family serine protease